MVWTEISQQQLNRLQLYVFTKSHGPEKSNSTDLGDLLTFPFSTTMKFIFVVLRKMSPQQETSDELL